MWLQTWPLSFRQRTFSFLMVILAATGYRRWLSRPWQWSLRDYMVVVAVCRGVADAVQHPYSHDCLLHNPRRCCSRLPEPGQARLQVDRYLDPPGHHPAHRCPRASGDGANEKPHARKQLLPICGSRQIHPPAVGSRMKAVRWTNARHGGTSRAEDLADRRGISKGFQTGQSQGEPGEHVTRAIQ